MSSITRKDQETVRFQEIALTSLKWSYNVTCFFKCSLFRMEMWKTIQCSEESYVVHDTGGRSLATSHLLKELSSTGM